MGRTDADIQAAQLLAGFGSAGFGPPSSKGPSFRPPAFGRGQPLPPLARVVEEGDAGGADNGQHAAFQLQTGTPPPMQRAQRAAVTPLTGLQGQYPLQEGGSPTLHELPPLQSPLPPPMRPSGSMPRGGLNRSETADSYTSQALREYAAGKAGGKAAGGRPPSKGEPMFVGPSRPRTAAARALLAGTTLHPVVRLGWKPLCEVHCNGLTGFFLGGHDRDLYIKCTSAEYRYLPMVDVSQGGCIMTCSHFEKAAGRELSKKWKESIHVAGEGEGSKATLVAWLKRRAEADFGAAVVGRHVWVCWCADAEYYMGEIISYSRENGKHKVKYSDRFVEELHLPVEKLDFGPTKPTISFDPADCGFSELAQRQAGNIGSINRSRSAPAATLRAYAASYANAGLLHQCSNVSASSDFNEEQLLPPAAAAAPQTAERPPERRSRLRDTSPTQTSPTLSDAAQHAMRPPPVAVSRRRRSAAMSPDQPPDGAGGGSSSVSEESDATPGAPPPKKRRSGSARPSAAGQEFAARLAEASGPAHPLSRAASLDRNAHLAQAAPLERGASLDRPRPSAPSFNAWCPSDHKVVGQPQVAFAPPQSLAAATPAPVNLAARASPPAAGHDESNAAVMSRWMNRVAMALDDVLAARSAAATAAAEREGRADVEAGGGSSSAAGWGPGVPPSARFQTLLVHARRRDCLQGFYEAMLERWDFFKDQPAQLEAKMADLILAFCHGSEQPATPRSPPRALPARSATPQEASDMA